MFLFWASLADRLEATSSAFGSCGFELGCETGTSVKDLDPGVAFAVGWAGTGVSSPYDWTSLAVVRDLGTAISLAGSLSGTQASVAWRVIGAAGPS